MKKILLIFLCGMSFTAHAINSNSDNLSHYNPLDNKILHGPIHRVVTFYQQLSPGLDMSAEEIVKKNQGKNYTEEIYDTDRHIIESGVYKNKKVTILQIWTPSDKSPYVYRGNYLNSKRKIKENSIHEIVAYNTDGTIMQIVNASNDGIKAQMRYEYNANGQLTAKYILYQDTEEFQQEFYTYDGQNRLAEYRYFYKPDKLSSGYKFQYSDSVVVKDVFWGDPENQGEPTRTYYYLDTKGRVVKTIQTGGVYGEYEEVTYTQFDEYDNWTEKKVRKYRRDAVKTLVDENHAIWYPGKVKNESRTIRLIEYY
jgi:YD repeat-containing protein